jgi:hypothetical protein
MTPEDFNSNAVLIGSSQQIINVIKEKVAWRPEGGWNLAWRDLR